MVHGLEWLQVDFGGDGVELVVVVSGGVEDVDFWFVGVAEAHSG